MATEYTRHMLDEFIKCRDDRKYFIENYFKTDDYRHNGLTNIKLNEFQDGVLNNFASNRYVLEYSDRMAGKTTLAAALFLHMICFEHDRTGFIIAHRQDAANGILRNVVEAWNFLPEWMRPIMTGCNRSKIEFENGIQIHASGAGSESMRGRSISFAYFDEFEYWRKGDLERLRDNFLPVVMSGNKTRVLMLSTGWGRG